MVDVFGIEEYVNVVVVRCFGLCGFCLVWFEGDGVVWVVVCCICVIG